MKVLTIFGTRPEIIRLSVLIELLDRHCEQILVHTGQNYDPSLSEVFLRELRVRPVDYHLGVMSTGFGKQVGQILAKVDELLTATLPDRLLILGDTNSALSAIVAARRGIPVYHMEAGNRCFDNRVPEEINRRIVDHSSDVLLPYTRRSAENLVAEGIQRQRIFVTGNPIGEVLERFEPSIAGSEILERLGLAAGEFFLVTLHRAENVDSPERLNRHLLGLASLSKRFGKVAIVSVHPRTADRIERAGIKVDPSYVRLEKPFGLFDFIKLEKSAFGVVTDSGTVQEEACLFGVPNVTIRDVTERPETTECGSNILAGCDEEYLVRGMRMALDSRGWVPPEEYTKRNVAATVARVLLSYH